MHKPLYVIIAAGGGSVRMNGTDKILADIGGRPIIAHAVEPFLKNIPADTIVIAAHRRNKTALKKLFPQKTYPQIQIINGGKNRFSSVQNGFKHIQSLLQAQGLSVHASDEMMLIIHNAANPFATLQEIRAVMRSAARTGASIVASPITGTLKSVDIKANSRTGRVIARVGKIIKTINRKTTWEAQTPQAFQYDVLAAAYARHKGASHATITDESMLVENAGFPITVVPASEWNKKITTRYDLAAAQFHASIKSLSQTPAPAVYGIGTDVHWFEERRGSPLARALARRRTPNKSLKLCGVAVSGYPNLRGNSDGDAALHAIATALSQAIGKGSLGTFADKLCARGITDSARYLDPLLRELARTHKKIIHIGLHFECAKPRIDPIAETFKASLARITKLPRTHIGITATSGEATTPAGKGKAVSCTAIVSIASTPARKKRTTI